MMSINSTLFWTIVNFFVLIYLLQRYLYKTLLKIIDQRLAKIQADLDQAAEEKERAAELTERYQTRIGLAREKAQEIISEAEKRGNEQREEIVAEARQEAKRIKERATEEIKQAKRQALSQLRDEVSKISLLIAQKFLQESVDKQRHQNLVEEFITQLDRDELGGSKC